MRCSLLLALGLMGCIGEKVPDGHHDYAACFEGVRLPVIASTDRGLVPDYCFHLPEDAEGVVTDPFAPEECRGGLIPDHFYGNVCVDYDRFSTLVYLPDEALAEVIFIAQSNVMRLAEQSLWPITKDAYGSYGRSPCGGDATCRGDEAHELVDCFVSVTDCALGEPPDYESLVLRTYHYQCSGVRACAFEGMPPEACCTLLP